MCITKKANEELIIPIAKAIMPETSKTMVLQRPPAGLAAVKKIQNDNIGKNRKKIIC